MAQQTQAQQITKIVEDLTSLRKEHGEAIADVRKQVGKIEARMKTYEEKQEESTAILKDVQGTVNGYDANIQAFMDFLKKVFKVVGTVAVGAAIIVLGAAVIALLHVPHP